MYNLDWFNYSDIYDKAVDQYDNCFFAELGCFIGNSTLYLAQKIREKKKNIKVVCVDLWPAPHEIKDLADIGAGQNAEGPIINSFGTSLMQNFIANLAEYRDIVIPIRTSTHNASKLFPPNYFKFIFVDAGHSYQQATQDLQDWYPLLSIDGTIAGHDYDSPGVEMAVTKFFGKVDTSNTSWSYNKMCTS